MGDKDTPAQSLKGPLGQGGKGVEEHPTRFGQSRESWVLALVLGHPGWRPYTNLHFGVLWVKGRGWWRGETLS